LEIIARLCGYWHYGNTAIEKRAIFFKRLLPLLDFGREREGIDLSKVVLTHHHLENRGKHAMPLSDGDAVKLYPIAEAGSGGVQVKEKAWLKPRTTPRNSLPTRRISRPASQRDHGGVGRAHDHEYTGIEFGDSAERNQGHFAQSRRAI
jgi:hypothetical protein